MAGNEQAEQKSNIGNSCKDRKWKGVPSILCTKAGIVDLDRSPVIRFNRPRLYGSGEGGPWSICSYAVFMKQLTTFARQTQHFGINLFSFLHCVDNVMASSLGIQH